MTTKSQEKVDEIGCITTAVFLKLNRLLRKDDLTKEQMVKLNEYTSIFSKYVHLMIDLIHGDIKQDNRETALELHRAYTELTNKVKVSEFAGLYTDLFIRLVNRIKKIAGYIEIAIETKTKVGNIFTHLSNQIKTFRMRQGN